MAKPEKATISIQTDEFAILDAIRRYAPEFSIDPVRAESYAIWTICFRRYCRQNDIPWLWMDSVSRFMDFLERHPNVSVTERNRALDGIMFYLNDVREAKDKEETRATRRPSDPQSTRSLFAQLLLRCDIRISEALRLRASNVQMAESRLSVPASGSRKARTVELPPSLRRGLKRQVQRVRTAFEDDDPLLFDRDRPPSDTDANTDAKDLQQSTQLATLVMNTLDQSAKDAARDSPQDSARDSARDST
jgi:hypothetical protein